MEVKEIDGLLYVRAIDVISYLRKDAENTRRQGMYTEATALDSVASAIWYMTRPELDD
jgi:hypothetical protein